MRVAIINLGCPKNRVDAEIILGQLVQKGFQITGDASGAQAVLVNTCAFLEEAIEESAEVIEAQEERRRKGEIEKLLVTGCLPQRETRELEGRFPWVDAFLGMDAIPKIPEILKENTRMGSLEVSSTPCWNPGQEYPRLLSTPSHYAYLRLTEGCDNRCAYCTIPMIRGPLRLRVADDVLAEARDLAGIGVREIILIAQDTAAHPELSGILEGLEKIEGIRWIRLLYAHPAHLSEGIIQRMAESEKVLNYLDMPIQHLADSVLARMNRHSDSAKIRRLVGKARGLDPEFTLRTTVMVGFPGEQEEEFEELLNGLKDLRFTHLGMFVYSPEEGTDAARMDGQVPESIKEDRAKRLLDFAQSRQVSTMQDLIGSEREAVVDYLSSDGPVGRLSSDAPEIDRLVRIDGDAEPGEFGKVKITGGKDAIFTARWIESF